MENNITEKEWRGYTLDELRVRRLICLTRIELEKGKIAQKYDNLFNKEKKRTAFPLLGKLLGAFDYFDYALMAFTIGKRAFKLFRRKK